MLSVRPFCYVGGSIRLYFERKFFIFRFKTIPVLAREFLIGKNRLITVSI